jgi:hypothetical protein
MLCRKTCWELCSNVDVPELHLIANLEGRRTGGWESYGVPGNIVLPCSEYGQISQLP